MQKLFHKVIWGISIFLGLQSVNVEASVTLTWNPTVTNEDGTPCNDLAGYKIYYDTDGAGIPYNGIGLNEGNSPILISVASLADPESPEAVLSGLTAGETYTIVVTAYDVNGNESGYSSGIDVLEGEVDSDGDGLSDVVESSFGLNPADEDSDGDGIRDDLEFGAFGEPLDSDGDGLIDPLDLDSDNDGVADARETDGDADGDGLANYRDSNDTDGPGGDQDGDGISNLDESSYGLNLNLADSDQDGISDVAEWGTGDLPLDTDDDGMIDALDADSDNDGAVDSEEAGVDSDANGVVDRLDNQTATVVHELGTMSVVVNTPQAGLVQTNFIEQATSSESKPEVTFPYGGVAYQVIGVEDGSTVLMTIVMPEVLPENAEYWKYDEIHGFQRLPSQVTGKVIAFQLTDGGLGDADGVVNGVIVDPGFIGIPETESTPSVSGGSGSSGDVVSSGGGGGGGCTLSSQEGEAADLILLFLPLALLGLYRKVSLQGRYD